MRIEELEWLINCPMSAEDVNLLRNNLIYRTRNDAHTTALKVNDYIKAIEEIRFLYDKYHVQSNHLKTAYYAYCQKAGSNPIDYPTWLENRCASLDLRWSSLKDSIRNSIVLSNLDKVNLTQKMNRLEEKHDLSSKR